MTSAMEVSGQTSSKQWPKNLLANLRFDFGNESKFKQFTLERIWTTSYPAWGTGSKLG